MEEKDESLGRALRHHFSFLLFAWDTLELYLGSLPVAATENRWPSGCPWPWSVRPPESGVLPWLSVQGRPLYLGALQVMETAAAIQGLRMEGVDVGLVDGRLGFVLPDEQWKILMRMPLRYSIGVRYVEQRKSIPHDLVIPTVLLAADIALASHIETISDARVDNVRWEDWHPGWRFVKAVAAIETLMSDGKPWPHSAHELLDYLDSIRRKCAWPKEPRQTIPLHVCEDHPSRSDVLRTTLTKEALELRDKHPALWSIGPRQDLIDASFNWLRPPLLMEYGRDSVRATRADIDRQTVNDLWADTWLNYVAWQIFGHNRVIEETPRIECFPWAKEGRRHACSSSNGQCRWFPPLKGAELPSSCEMLRTLRSLCGPYWERLRPL